MEEKWYEDIDYFRLFIDTLVIIMALSLIVPKLSYMIESRTLANSEYVDTVTPDYEKKLNDEITEIFGTMEPNFQDLYENRSPLNEYNFQYLETETSLRNSENFDRNAPSVVYISTEDSDGEYYGSGSIITPDGVIITNYHVVAFADKVIVTTSNGNHYKVERVLASDESLDIAFLKIEDNNFATINIGNSDDVRIGEYVLAIGTPEGFFNSLSGGIISGIRDYSSLDEGVQFQVTTSISEGNSGGPLLNEFGEIVGVLTSTLEYDFNEIKVENINFAIPINSALGVLEK